VPSVAILASRAMSANDPVAAVAAPQVGWADLRSMLHGFVARRVPPRDVEDVLHDVFVRIARNLGQLRDDDRLTAWMYQVARNAIVDYHRRPHLQREEPLTEAPDDAGADADEPAVACELAAHLRTLVGQLPSPYREALELTDLDGVTQAEAAARMGLSVPGMKSRVQRARAQLRDLLHDCCEIEVDVRGRIVECQRREQTEIPPACCGKPEA
jgi:RNA polymerase sigma-70 factor (ECF subfamily)